MESDDPLDEGSRLDRGVSQDAAADLHSGNSIGDIEASLTRQMSNVYSCIDEIEHRLNDQNLLANLEQKKRLLGSIARFEELVAGSDEILLAIENGVFDNWERQFGLELEMKGGKRKGNRPEIEAEAGYGSRGASPSNMREAHMRRASLNQMIALQRERVAELDQAMKGIVDEIKYYGFKIRDSLIYIRAMIDHLQNQPHKP